MSRFTEKYGPWAIIAGGALGLGKAWADALASRGVNIVSLDRDLPALETQQEALGKQFGVEIRPLHLDLTDPDLLGKVREETDDLEIGMMIYSAAIEVDPAIMAPHLFHDGSLEGHHNIIAVNVTGPNDFAHHFGALMKERGRGRMVLVSSGADGQGAPFVVNYGATKAYMTSLAEGLWFELGAHGVDVIAAPLGLTRTTALADFPDIPAMEADETVELILSQLGKRPQVIPGRKNALQQLIMKRLMPKKKAIRMFADIHLDNFLKGREDFDVNRK